MQRYGHALMMKVLARRLIRIDDEAVGYSLILAALVSKLLLQLMIDVFAPPCYTYTSN
jgi:hypothetical protein